MSFRILTRAGHSSAQLTYPFQKDIVVGEGKGAKFAHWLEDPWAKPEEREPLNINIEVLVMGAGFSGILTASKLKDAGITDFKIIDKASDFGGTWYW